MMFEWVLIGKNWGGKLTKELLLEKIEVYKKRAISPARHSSMLIDVKLDGGRLPRLKTKIFDSEVIIKQYGRGGIAGLVLPDLYFSRKPFEKEMKINEALLMSGFHTAEIMAILSVKFMVYCIVEQIGNSKNLKQEFRYSPNNIDWSNIGNAIGKLHSLGIIHHDLNMANILINEESKIFIIDFIGSRLRVKPLKKWRVCNIARLLRSYIKEGGDLKSAINIIKLLLDGYNRVGEPIKSSEVESALKKQKIFHTYMLQG